MNIIIQKNILRNCLTKMEINNITKIFILEFFKNSIIKDENGVLIISKVNKDIEDFIGKKSPYKLVFDINMHNKIKDSELIMQGSYFLSSLRDFLIDKGITSLKKIIFNQDLINSNILMIGKGKIIDIKQIKFNYLAEFNFISSFQYINEKKQFFYPILIKDNNVLNLNLNKFNIREGIPRDIDYIDLLNPYNVAKNHLTESLNKDIKIIKKSLSIKFEKELCRIENHYHKQIKEKDEEVDKCEEKIKILKGKLKHTFYDRDIRILNRLIKESNLRLENLKKRTYKERLVLEEKFHINDEIEKHSLSIKNSLINVTLYYYPIYNLNASDNGKNKTSIYDPLLDKII